MKKGLIIFAREPVPGKVKTRLASDMGENAAARIYSAMLEDTINNASLLKDTRIMIFWASDSDTLPTRPHLPQLEMHRQTGSDLGERMARAFETAFSTGIDSCCIVGSDSPDLPIQYIIQAFNVLEKSRIDIVYGPAADGGYYLLGMKKLWSRLFENMPWSSKDVTKETISRRDELELISATIPDWYDIDTFTDLQRLMNNSAQTAPLTHEVLNSIFPSTGTACKTGTI